MVVPASPSLVEPASLAVLARRYGAGAPAVVELIRRTGGCTSPIRLEGESVAVSAGTGAVLARRSTRAAGSGLRARRLWQPTRVAVSALLGALPP